MVSRRGSDNGRGPMGVDAYGKARKTRGRTGTSQTPVTIRDNAHDTPLDAERLRAVLGRKLGKFSRRLSRVLVVTHDESGPVGAPRVRATLSLTTTRQGVVVVTAKGTTSWAAAAAAVRSGERALRRLVERARAPRARGA